MQITRRRRALRTPAERVGVLPNADMPPPATPAGPDELLLARALLERDEHAFRRVVERLFTPMLRLARVYVRTRDEAEEVVQETWLAALRGIGGFRGRSSIRTWLFRILRNRARTRGKRAARMVPFSQLPPVGERAQAEVEPGALVAWDAPAGLRAVEWRDPEQQYLAHELGREIERALEQLPHRQREVVVLRDVQGWSSEDVCAALGLSPENQRVLLHRARSRVREAMMPYLAEPETEATTCVA